MLIFLDLGLTRLGGSLNNYDSSQNSSAYANALITIFEGILLIYHVKSFYLLFKNWM